MYLIKPFTKKEEAKKGSEKGSDIMNECGCCQGQFMHAFKKKDERNGTKQASEVKYGSSTAHKRFTFPFEHRVTHQKRKNGTGECNFENRDMGQKFNENIHARKNQSGD